MRLEFDPDKEATNLAKHGVDFSTVLRVFEDPDRLIVPNLKHSPEEPRFYAIGHDGSGILTDSRRGAARDRCRILEKTKESL